MQLACCSITKDKGTDPYSLTSMEWLPLISGGTRSGTKNCFRWSSIYTFGWCNKALFTLVFSNSCIKMLWEPFVISNTTRKTQPVRSISEVTIWMRNSWLKINPYPMEFYLQAEEDPLKGLQPPCSLHQSTPDTHRSLEHATRLGILLDSLVTLNSQTTTSASSTTGR